MKSPTGMTKWCLGLVVIIVFTVVSSGCNQPNNNPVISRLNAEKDRVAPSASSVIVCVASDADDDSLTYVWSATGGTFSGEGSVVTWMAPDNQGSHTISVSVTDGRGGEAVTQLTIKVEENHAPVIQGLTADPPLVNQGGVSTIRCVASDPDGDEISYLWTASRGSISGQGATVTWTAPMSCAEYEITVAVADGKGGEATKELKVIVRKPG